MKHDHELPRDPSATEYEYADGCYVRRLSRGAWGYVPAGEDRGQPVEPESKEARALVDSLPLLENVRQVFR